MSVKLRRGVVAVAHPDADGDGRRLRVGRLGQQAVRRHVLDVVGGARLEGHDPSLAAGPVEDLEVLAPVRVDVGIGVARQDVGRQPRGLGAPDLPGLRVAGGVQGLAVLVADPQDASGASVTTPPLPKAPNAATMSMTRTSAVPMATARPALPMARVWPPMNWKPALATYGSSALLPSRLRVRMAGMLSDCWSAYRARTGPWLTPWASWGGRRASPRTGS